MASEVGKVLPIERPRVRQHTAQIDTQARVEFKDITEVVQTFIRKSGVESGVCHVFVPHTTAAVLIQEHADPALARDLDRFLERLAPPDAGYAHDDGNCDSHLKASVIGCSQTLLIEDGKLVLGRWQGLFFCEFDGPRRRELKLKVVSD